MEKELVVKVSYVLGNNSAFVDAANQAEGVNQRINKVGESFLSKMQSQFSAGGLGGTALGLLRGGFSSVAGVGAAGAITGGIVSDMMMGAGGGLRGRGISGMNDSFWGMVLGRDTQEAAIDRTMQASSYMNDRTAIAMHGRESELAARRGSMFLASTQVDPFKRLEEERAILVKRQIQAHEDYQKLLTGKDAGRALVNKFHDDQNDNTLEGKRAREADLAKYESNFLEARKRLAEADLQRVNEINNLDKHVFEQRKSMIRDFKLGFGSMTQPEQEAFKVASDMLKAKQDLLPEQVAMLRMSPAHQEALNEHLIDRANRGGANEALRGAGGDIGRAVNLSKGLRESTGINIEPEEFLDAKTKFEMSQKLKQLLGNALGDVIASLTANTGWLTQMLQSIAWERGKQGDRK